MTPALEPLPPPPQAVVFTPVAFCMRWLCTEVHSEAVLEGKDKDGYVRDDDQHQQTQGVSVRSTKSLTNTYS